MSEILDGHVFLSMYFSASSVVPPKGLSVDGLVYPGAYVRHFPLPAPGLVYRQSLW
jgi:hypothetical protein